MEKESHDLLIHEREYRSKELMAKIALQPIMVCGCGAIGSNLIDNIARQGFLDISVIDMDRIEKHNIGSQIWEKREAGNFKVRRMKERVYAINGTTIKNIEKELKKENVKKFIKPSHLIIDAFDNTKSRALLYNHCNNMNCLHIGLHQDYAEVIWNEQYTVPKENKGLNICEYPLARNTVLLSVTVASEILIKFIKSGEKRNCTITLNDFKIRNLEEQAFKGGTDGMGW